MVKLLKWLAKIAIIVWLLVVVIALIGCYTTPEQEEEPSIEVRENTKEKAVDISFFKWMRSEKCVDVEATEQGLQDLTGKARVEESRGTA